MARPSRFSAEMRERAVRMVWEHQAQHVSQWAAITSIAEKIGCVAETPRSWMRQGERDAGHRPGLTTTNGHGSSSSSARMPSCGR